VSCWTCFKPRRTTGSMGKPLSEVFLGFGVCVCVMGGKGWGGKGGLKQQAMTTPILRAPKQHNKIPRRVEKCRPALPRACTSVKPTASGLHFCGGTVSAADPSALLQISSLAHEILNNNINILIIYTVLLKYYIIVKNINHNNNIVYIIKIK